MYEYFFLPPIFCRPYPNLIHKCYVQCRVEYFFFLSDVSIPTYIYIIYVDSFFLCSEYAFFLLHYFSPHSCFQDQYNYIAQCPKNIKLIAAKILVWYNRIVCIGICLTLVDIQYNMYNLHQAQKTDIYSNCCICSNRDRLGVC